jgi:uncharacterized protein (DUF433 family)
MNNAVESTQHLSWPYLEWDEQGRVRIADTRIRVSWLVQEKQAHGWSPEELHFQHPTMSLAQIYSAFSYYYAHQQEIDREIATEHQNILELKTQLRALGTGYDAAEFETKLQAKVREK